MEAVPDAWESFWAPNFPPSLMFYPQGSDSDTFSLLCNGHNTAWRLPHGSCGPKMWQCVCKCFSNWSLYPEVQTSCFILLTGFGSKTLLWSRHVLVENGQVEWQFPRRPWVPKNWQNVPFSLLSNVCLFQQSLVWACSEVPTINRDVIHAELSEKWGKGENKDCCKRSI